MLAKVLDSVCARSWISRILSLTSPTASCPASASARRTGLDWSMMVHSASCTARSSDTHEPTGPAPGPGSTGPRMLQKIFSVIIHNIFDALIFLASNLYFVQTIYKSVMKKRIRGPFIWCVLSGHVNGDNVNKQLPDRGHLLDA